MQSMRFREAELLQWERVYQKVEHGLKLKTTVREFLTTSKTGLLSPFLRRKARPAQVLAFRLCTPSRSGMVGGSRSSRSPAREHNSECGFPEFDRRTQRNSRVRNSAQIQHRSGLLS